MILLLSLSFLSFKRNAWSILSLFLTFTLKRKTVKWLYKNKIIQKCMFKNTRWIWRHLFTTNRQLRILQVCKRNFLASNLYLFNFLFFLIYLLNLIFLGKKQINWPIRLVFIVIDIKTSISQAGSHHCPSLDTKSSYNIIVFFLSILTPERIWNLTWVLESCNVIYIAVGPEVSMASSLATSRVSFRYFMAI